MTAWWQNLSRRERMMVTVMMMLIVVVVILLGAVRPLVNYRDAGRLSLESAQTTQLLVSQAVRNAGGEQGETGTTGAALRGIVTSYAGQDNIPVTAFQLSQTGGSVIISVENVSADRLFAWLDRMAVERNISVTEARISPARSGETTVQARLTLTQGA